MSKHTSSLQWPLCALVAAALATGPGYAQFTFGPEVVVSECGPNAAYAVEAGDLDGDGDADMVVASYVDGEITVFENLGGGDFADALILVSGETGARDLTLGDIDGDGDLDIAYAAQLADRFAWLRNEGGLQFTTPLDIVTNPIFKDCATGIRLAPIDANSTLDAISCNCSGFGNVRWWANSGDGMTWTMSEFAIGSTPDAQCLDIGDINGDGWNEALAGGNGYTYYILENGVSMQGLYQWGEIGQPLVSSVSIVSDPPNGATIAYALPLANEVWLGQYSLDDPLNLLSNGGLYQSVSSPSFVDQTPLGVLVISEGDHAVYLNGSAFPLITDVHGGKDAVVEDFDADGDYDIAIATTYGCHITYYENNAGFFTPRCLAPLASTYTRPTAADLNNDGLVDVLAPQYAGITWYQALGAGVFSEAIPIELDWHVFSAAAADMDSDGDQDVVSIVQDQDPLIHVYERVHVQWYPNDGSGSFGAPVMFVDSFPDRFFALADMDGDEDMDVITLHNLGLVHDLLWTANNGDGTPGATTVFAPGANITQLASFDVDTDGDMDVVVTDQTVGAKVFLNGGDGSSFTALTLSGLVFQPGVPTAADVNNDGIMDIALPNYTSSRVDVFYGIGGGAFSPIAALVPSNGNRVGSLAFADLDVDGDADMGIMYEEPGTCTVWTNNGIGTFTDPVQVTDNAPMGRYLTFTDMGADGTADALMVSAGREAVLYNELGDFNTGAPSGNSIEQAIHVWPVPAREGVLHLDRAVSGIVLDIHGHRVAVVNASRTVDVDHLAAGLYVLRTGRAAIRFVVE